ncbi:prostatic spermine-binding protein-like [Stylophora pistillata]|uniref:prostatic spermine-binding protein-like n=1 Tax=Stylophora pistillata TaxID=50429 RepID=UPI000C04CA3C|nr:prostatic spermine-binding protein-like [Stylophora pistillata]
MYELLWKLFKHTNCFIPLVIVSNHSSLDVEDVHIDGEVDAAADADIKASVTDEGDDDGDDIDDDETTDFDAAGGDNDGDDNGESASDDAAADDTAAGFDDEHEDNSCANEVADASAGVIVSNDEYDDNDDGSGEDVTTFDVFRFEVL